MEQHIFLPEYFEVIEHSNQPKRTVLVALLRLIRRNLMEWQNKIFKKSLNETTIFHQLLLIIRYYQT